MAEDARRKMTTRLVLILLVFNIVCGTIIWRSAVGTSELSCQLDFAMSQTIGAETDWSAAEDTTARNARQKRLTWRDIHSEDYQQYARNLRNLGMPQNVASRVRRE